MSTCAVMLVKDEADIIETTIRHLAAHVDEILVADNLSTDGTPEIIGALADEGLPVRLSVDEEPAYYQAQKTTALAQRALELGHRWVIPCDADEIWYAPEGRTLRDWLDAIGREHQFVKAAIYNHVATVDDDDDTPDPVARIQWRQRVPLDIRWGKVACRLRPDLEIHQGNHSASTTAVGATGHGLELRHFPYRSAEQFIRKAINGYAAYKATDLDESIGQHWRVYGRTIEEHGEEAGRSWFYDAFWSSDPHGDDSLVHDPAPVRR